MSIRHYITKFVLLTWKLHKTQWNRPWELAWLVLVPLFMAFIAVAMRLSIVANQTYNSIYDPIDMEKTWNDLVGKLEERQRVGKEFNKKSNVFMPEMIVAWAPKSHNIFDKIMQLAILELPTMSLRSYGDCDEMIKAVKNDHLYAGVCFDPGVVDQNVSLTPNNLLMPNEVVMTHFNYSLVFPSELRVYYDTFIGDNWKTIHHDDPRTPMVRRLNDVSKDGRVAYVREGFIKLQMVISETYLKLVSGKVIPKIVLRRFPVDGRIQDPLASHVIRGLPLLIIVGYLFPSQILVWQIVEEKQRHMRRFLINMNIGNLIHFMSWYFKGLTYLFVSSVLIMFFVKVPWNSNPTLLSQTPWYILLMVLTLYSMATTSFCLMFASFFKSSEFALRLVTVFWLLTYMPFFVLWNNRERSVLFIRYVSCALPNTVIALVCEGLMEREVFFDGQNVDLGDTLNHAANRINVYQATCIFLATTFVYGAIGLYMDVWNMGETGGRRHKHIPVPLHSGDFTFQDRDDSTATGSHQPGVKATKIYEVEPSHRRFKVKIKKLCQRYEQSAKSSLNFFTLNVYENEVTVLMGHNGCGKTTLLRILAGLLQPSRGVVLVAEYNIHTERHDASMQLGLALGEDLLFQDFTVADQIRFVCMVKGFTWSEASDQIEVYTQMLNLTSMKRKRIRSLTARERSLICIGCAFAGGSPVVLIDDLHYDLDLVSQSLICDLINEEKSRRTIILVTNSTSLASHLADRLAIMSQGELKCTGSKPFLRNMYGHGFRLTFVKGKAFDMPNLKVLLSKYIPNLTVESNIGFKVTFVLETKYEETFPEMFDDIEANMADLDIISFRLRDTSLDEIFLRFGAEDTEASGDPNVMIEDLKHALAESDNVGRDSGCKRIRMHFRALLYMRLLINKRHIPIMIVNIIALILATACTFSTTLLYGKNYQLVNLSFNLTQLHSIDAFVELMSDSMEVKEMEAFFSELLFWYDGHVKELETDELTDFYLLQQTEFNKIINFRYMFGTSFADELITVWYNNIPLHVAPFALNLVHNVVARRYFNEEASIDVQLIPLPFHNEVHAGPQTRLCLGAMIGINLSFIFANMWQGMAVYSILENSFKNQQFLTGVRLSTYTCCLVVFDIVRVLPVSLGMIFMICFYLSPRHDLNLYMWIFLMLTMVGLAVTSLSYIFSTLFKEPNNAYIAVSFINAIGIVIFAITVGNHLADMTDIFQVLTQYAFGEVIFKLFFLYEYTLLCKDPDVHFVSTKVEKCKVIPNCCKSYKYTKEDYGGGFDMFMMVFSFVGPLLVFVMREHYKLMSWTFLQRAIPKKCTWSEKKDHRARHEGVGEYVVDESVIAERHRVEKMTDQERSETTAVCKGVGKRYHRKSILIRIDMCISKAEVVGLMGYNNTGKTTFMKIMVGEKRASHGRIWLGGRPAKQQSISLYPIVGYCAQEQILPIEITPCELLHIQAHLHGISMQCMDLVCETLAHVLGFASCYRHLIRSLTPGEHRRLGFAVAIMGDPRLVCVDGPPGGLDPTGKRTIYVITNYMETRGCSFLFTNFSGLECERMCHRSPVLYDGQLLTMGNQDQRYSRGYLMEVRFKRKVNADLGTARSTWERINKFPVSPTNKFILFCQIKFPKATLQNQHENAMSFYVPRRTTSFSEIFLTLRRDSYELNIEDFYITCNTVVGTQSALFDRSAVRTAENLSKSSKQ